LGNIDFHGLLSDLDIRLQILKSEPN
jgi:hypothetical protein